MRGRLDYLLHLCTQHNCNVTAICECNTSDVDIALSIRCLVPSLIGEYGWSTFIIDLRSEFCAICFWDSRRAECPTIYEWELRTRCTRIDLVAIYHQNTELARWPLKPVSFREMFDETFFHDRRHVWLNMFHVWWDVFHDTCLMRHASRFMTCFRRHIWRDVWDNFREICLMFDETCSMRILGRLKRHVSWYMFHFWWHVLRLIKHVSWDTFDETCFPFGETCFTFDETCLMRLV
jgi:hypothetical protein